MTALRWLSRGGFVLAMGWLWGCSAVPEMRYYELTSPSAMSSSESADVEGTWLGVEELTMDPPYDQERLVYRTGASSAEVGFYEFTRWAAPLGQLLQRDLVNVLSQTSDNETPRRVEPAMPGRPYDLVLRGRVLRAEQVDRRDGSVEVHLQLSLQLFDSQQELRWHRDVAGQAAGRATDGDAVMSFMRQAAAQVLEEVRRGVVPHLEANLPSS